MKHTPFLFLSFYLPLSVTHTQAGLLNWESLTALCTLVCGRVSIHYVCPTHTDSLHGSVPHTRHACAHADKCKQGYMHACTKWPADTQAFSQMPRKLLQGLKLCITHTHTHTHRHTERHTHTPCSQILCVLQNRCILWLCKHPAPSPFHFRWRDMREGGKACEI